MKAKSGIRTRHLTAKTGVVAGCLAVEPNPVGCWTESAEEQVEQHALISNEIQLRAEGRRRAVCDFNRGDKTAIELFLAGIADSAFPSQSLVEAT
jgi:hypothetical protein